MENQYCVYRKTYCKSVKYLGQKQIRCIDCDE